MNIIGLLAGVFDSVKSLEVSMSVRHLYVVLSTHFLILLFQVCLRSLEALLAYFEETEPKILDAQRN